MLQIVTGVILGGLILVVTLGLLRFRKLANEDDPAAVDDLSDFRQMRDAGSLEQEEYVRLKQIISDQTLAKAKDGD